MPAVVEERAAGNAMGLSAGYPARYPGVISVGALDADGRLADFSAGHELDVAAPGTGIIALDSQGRLVKVNGTSFAAAKLTSHLLKAFLRGENSKTDIARVLGSYSLSKDSK